MSNTMRLAAALAVLLAAGCSDGGSAGTATATPEPGFGRATRDDLRHLDLPVYPRANTSDSDVIKAVENGWHSITLATTTYASFRDVDEWYAGHLETEFQVKHLASAQGDQAATYSDVEPADDTPLLKRTVSLEPAKDATGKAIVVITLHTDSASGKIPSRKL